MKSFQRFVDNTSELGSLMKELLENQYISEVSVAPCGTKDGYYCFRVYWRDRTPEVPREMPELRG